MTGEGLLFDLETDPGEEIDLSGNPAHQEETEEWRSTLAAHLADRPEGFSDGESLQTVDSDEAWG